MSSPARGRRARVVRHGGVWPAAELRYEDEDSRTPPAATGAVSYGYGSLADASPAPPRVRPASPAAEAEARAPGPRRAPPAAGYDAALVVGVTLTVLACMLGTYYAKTRSGPEPPNDQIDTSSAVGWVAVGSAVVTFGSYGVLVKSPAVQRAAPSTMVFQLYYSLGVALSSMLALLVTENPGFSWWGVLGAGLWVSESLAAYLAIHGLGYAAALAVWAGLTIVVSFVWGAAVFGQEVDSVAGSAAALFALVAGVAGVASAQSGAPERLRRWVWDGAPPDGGDGDASRLLAVGQGGGGDDGGGGGTGGDANVNSSDGGGGGGGGDAVRVSPGVGLACACLVGLFNGSLEVPFHYYQNERDESSDTAVQYLVPFGLGVALVTAACFVVYALWVGPRSVRLVPRAVALPGLATGFFWSVGNYAATLATAYLGLTIGFPLTQGAIVVAGLWGILYYREVRGAYPISFFLVGVVFILGGATLLALSVS